MKKGNFVVISFVLMLFFQGHFLLESTRAESFKIELRTKIQDPISKTFILEANVVSEASNDRVSVSWELPDGLTSEDFLIQDAVDILKGENYYTLAVNPIQEVDGYIFFTVESFESTKRLLTTQKAQIYVNKDLELEPITEEYSTLKYMIGLRDIFQSIFWVLLGFAMVTYVAYRVLNRLYPERPTPKTAQNSQILRELERRRLETQTQIS